jgi:hypothetical protein
MRGYGSEEMFAELQSGIRKIAGYIYEERFTLDSAILCAAKAAYLSTLIKSGATEIFRFDPNLDMSDWLIVDPNYNKLNKVKKSSPEAFFLFLPSSCWLIKFNLCDFSILQKYLLNLHQEPSTFNFTYR